MNIRYGVSISKDIKELIQSRTYEKIICNLMNESVILFPNSYKQVSSQSHGECDFVDTFTEKKYDAKLLFSNTQCQIIAKGIDSLATWVRDVLNELTVASEKLINKDWKGIRDTSLYKEMLDRLLHVANDENGILFIPFPIVPAVRQSIFLQFAYDIVSVTFNAISEDYPDSCSGKDIVMIYPSPIDQLTVLRDLKTNRKEYLPIVSLSPFITFSTRVD